MEQIPIGEAARRLGMRPSALRYYEERGLVRSSGRVRGRRVYGHEELRRLAFVRIAQGLGIPLETAAVVMDEPGERWRAAVGDEIAKLDELIDRARGARDFLTQALRCPADHPARECPHFTRALDDLVDGHPFERPASEQRDRSAQ